MKEINIGIVGLGYVGKACLSFFKRKHNCYSFDINNSGTESSIKALVKKVDIVFLCIPTPMKQSGECDISIVKNVLTQINELNIKLPCIIKSTIPPGTSKIFNDAFDNLQIIFNPEFLTEANFIEDFKNQDRIIIGDKNKKGLVNDLYEKSFPKAKIINCSYEEAEMVKYFTNTFLATKVSFANEMFELCNKLNINYDNVYKLAILDKRLGFSHFKVPGPDGSRGFGGTCLPKDINAILNIFNTNDLKSYILESVWERNINQDRKEQDWKKLKGRAVTL